MKDLLNTIKRTVDAAKASGHRKLPSKQIDAFKARYRGIVNRALEPYLTQPPKNAPPQRGLHPQSKTKNLRDRLDQYQTETLRFMTDFRVPFDNNQAERDIRMVKVKQKLSVPFRSREGTPYVCRIRGFISACFRNLLTHFVSGRMEGWKNGRNPSHPSILPSFQSVKFFSRKFETCQNWIETYRWYTHCRSPREINRISSNNNLSPLISRGEFAGQCLF